MDNIGTIELVRVSGTCQPIRVYMTDNNPVSLGAIISISMRENKSRLPTVNQN